MTRTVLLQALYGGRKAIKMLDVHTALRVSTYGFLKVLLYKTLLTMVTNLL